MNTIWIFMTVHLKMAGFSTITELDHTKNRAARGSQYTSWWSTTWASTSKWRPEILRMATVFCFEKIDFDFGIIWSDLLIPKLMPQKSTNYVHFLRRPEAGANTMSKFTWKTPSERPRWPSFFHWHAFVGKKNLRVPFDETIDGFK